MAMLTAGLICPPLRCKLHIAKVAMLNPNDKDISSVDGGWSGFHVMVVPVVRKMKKKVARNSTRALAQKCRLFSSDISIILLVLTDPSVDTLPAQCAPFDYLATLQRSWHIMYVVDLFRPRFLLSWK